MMSAVDNELYKASPISLSTQDFILDSKDRSCGVTPLGVALTRIDLQQSLNGYPSRIYFNRDAKFYTPAFVGFTAEHGEQSNDQFLREIFERKIVESSSAKAKIVSFQPKPSSDFCSICKESFTDYLKHIDHPIHKKKLEASQCEGDISELCKLAKKRSTKSGEQINDAEVLGRKRRKMEDSTAYPLFQKNDNECNKKLFQSGSLLAVSNK